MEKKNTMLLTVIAVATLLVAVVGATFAYFSLTVSGSTNTTATVTTGKTGLFTFDKGKENLKLNIGTNLMAESLVSGEMPTSIDYYADPEGGDTPKTVSPGKATADASDFASIGKLTLSNADKGTKYHCQAKYTITTEFTDADGVQDGNASSVKESIDDSDGMLYLKTNSADATINIVDDNENKPADSGEVTETSHTLKSLVSETKTFWVTYDFTSTGNNMEADLQAALKVSNRNADQNYLAAKKITVSIKSGTVTCNIADEE